MTRAYKYIIIYFFVFSAFLLLSAYMLFETKIGFSFRSVMEYYIGNQSKFINAKTYIGLLKIIVPHIISFALFIMVITHFFIFTKSRYTKRVKFLIGATYTSALVELISPFGIINGINFFVYLKIISFALFILLILYAIYLLFSSIVYD